MARFLRTAALLAAAAGAAGACGPAAKDGDTGPKLADPTGPEPQDASLTFEPIAVPGTYFVPDALDRPGMLLARPPRKTTLDKQRAAFKKAKADAKEGEALILATMLFEQAQAEADDGKRTALLQEARDALAEARAARGAATDAVVLHDLAVIAYELKDLAGAAEALAAAVAAAPEHAQAAERRAHLAFYHLRAGRNGQAAAAVAGASPSKDAPELAYAIAWTAWRTGDLEGARAAIRAAVDGWDRPDALPAIRRDALVFAARTGASVDEAAALAAAYAAHVKDAPHLKGLANATLETLVYMHQAFKYAGRFADSIALVDRMFQVKPNLNKADAPKLYLEQADAAKRLGLARELAEYVTRAAAALEACGADCPAKDRDATAKIVFGYARYANYLYTTSQDEAWFEAATSLYGTYLRMPGIPDEPTVAAEATTLQSNHARAKANAGTHDKGALTFILGDQGYAPQVVGCYDRFLQRDPGLQGALTLKLEIAATGEVTGAAADPGAGEDGIAGVAACAIEAARAWKFPARTMPGVTRIAVAYRLQPQAAP